MRIVFVDDAAVSRALFTRIATALDHEVVAIVDPLARDLARAVRDLEPDLVVLDARFGDPLGTASEERARVRTLVTSLRDALPKADVAIVAALGETALVSTISVAGAAYVIPRPFVRSSVAAVLAAVVRERAQRA